MEGQTRVIHDCRSYRRKNTAVENAPATRAIKLYETASRSRWRLKSRQQIALDILQVESLVRQVGGEEACSPLEPAIERGPRVLEAHLHTSMQAHQRSSAILRGPQRYLKGHLQSGMQAYSRHTWPSVAIKVAISGHQWQSVAIRCGFTGYQMHVQTRGVPGARIPHRHSGATPAPQYRRPKRVPNPPSLRLI